MLILVFVFSFVLIESISEKLDLVEEDRLERLFVLVFVTGDGQESGYTFFFFLEGGRWVGREEGKGKKKSSVRMIDGSSSVDVERKQLSKHLKQEEMRFW